jgi:Tol biopolymer transport system component
MVDRRKHRDPDARDEVTAAFRRAPTALLALLLVSAACSDATGPGGKPVVLFDWMRDGNRDIYRATLETLDTLRLTTDPGDDQHPTAGGGNIVFTSYRAGNGELYSIPERGGTARRLTNTSTNETQPALSRDGSRLAFISDESGSPKLWIAGGNGEAAQRATPAFGFPGSAEASPSWSPSGDRLVFVATSNGSADLFTLVPGASPETLVDDSLADVEPSWSADGRQVAFVSDRDGDAELYVVDVQTRQVRRLTNRPGIDAQPSWLADGRIVYTAWEGAIQHLRWLDPADPARTGEVNLGTGSGAAAHATAIF